jgi:hypothetical protein
VAVQHRKYDFNRFRTKLQSLGNFERNKHAPATRQHVYPSYYFVCPIIAVCPIQLFSNVFDLSCNVLAIIHRITGDILKSCLVAKNHRIQLGKQPRKQYYYDSQGLKLI